MRPTIKIGDIVVGWYGSIAIEGKVLSTDAKETALYVTDTGPTWYGTKYIVLPTDDIMVITKAKQTCTCGADAVQAPGHAYYCDSFEPSQM